ncbi:hypothetical protein [Chitinophaga sp. 212800010-3]|uniref:hypothetical protein n=1 Tax=unclassified Chitinophaga TaxID=2619133 RepID=UPI002DF6656D|nr:NfeD domain-containing protein [Chitinophaga sp. 212800010-3]
MNLLLFSLFAVATGLTILLYRNRSRKTARMFVPIRSASIIKILSYKSAGILATIRFKDELSPQIGDRLLEEGALYEITGVVVPDIAKERPADTWDCRIVKI